MKILSNFLRMKNGHSIGSDVKIYCIPNRAGIGLFFQIYMTDLARRMDPCVSPTGRMKDNFFARKLLDGLLQGLLHGHAVGLSLPTNKRASVIFDR